MTWIFMDDLDGVRLDIPQSFLESRQVPMDEAPLLPS